MAPGYEAMAIILGIFFDLLHNNGILSVFIRIASMRRFPFAILMSTHNIQFNDEMIKFTEIFVFGSFQKNY